MKVLQVLLYQHTKLEVESNICRNQPYSNICPKCQMSRPYGSLKKTFKTFILIKDPRSQTILTFGT